MTEGDLTIQGNSFNGYMVVQNVNGEWLGITKRFDTYDKAAVALAHIEGPHDGAV